MSAASCVGDTDNVIAGTDAVVTLRGGVAAVQRVRIARSFRSRLIGLLDRSGLDSDEGLLFDPGGSIHTLWMRFTIDIVFLDEQLRVLRIAPDIKPWRFVWAPSRTRFVLELAAGSAANLGLQQPMLLRVCRQEETSTRPQ
jgi:uncharacterized protein